jgi:Uma2 family endonuclease
VAYDEFSPGWQHFPMAITQSKPTPTLPDYTELPDHTQLPESDGSFVKNLQEHPQSLLLTSSIAPVLDALHPDGQYVIGQDSGIYWQMTTPPEKGAECPDWFYVPNVSPLLDGKRRRSYVMWKETVVPLIAIEFTSGNGSEERDTTSPFSVGSPKAGEFWVYEQALRIPFYAIYEVEKASVEVYELVNNYYKKCVPNQRGRYFIPALGVELGIWQGEFMHQDLPWLRWWDSNGNLLLSGDERAKKAELRIEEVELRVEEADRRANEVELRAEEADRRANEADRKAEKLAARLRELGINPDD